MVEETRKLIYFADPMCSWCYGFAPELTKVVEQLGDSVKFEMVMGGLRPYNTETMTQLGDFLKKHWEEVETKSGQPFSHDILKDTSFVYDTEPACRAVVLMRELLPKQEFNFFKAIQTAFYRDNKNTNETSTYIDLLQDFEVNKNLFRESFESEPMKVLVKADFKNSNALGIKGFPTLIFQKGEDLFLLSKGYISAKHILDHISNIIAEKS